MKEEGIFHKCGEIFSANAKNFSFLCYFCNELFYDFNEFKAHSEVHANLLVDESHSDGISQTDNDHESIVDYSDDEQYHIYDSVRSSMMEIDKNISDEHIKFKNEVSEARCGNLDDKVQNKQNIKVENEITYDEEKLNGSCPHCKRFFETSAYHDVQECCRVVNVIKQHNGDFIKLLREGILCCFSCHQYFRDYKKLFNHHIDEKHCLKITKCKICKFYSFMNSKVKNKSLKPVIENQSKMSCKACGINFTTSIDYNFHLKTIHNFCEDNFNEKNDEDVVYYCEYCKKKFDTKIDYTEHEQIHENKEQPFKCLTCEKTFKTKYQMQIHMRIHSNTRPYKCKLCSAAFTVATNLKNHIVYKHTDDRPFTCEFNGCNATFKLYNLKKQHEKRHLPAKFQCEICGNYYKSKFNLLKHQKSRHTDSENWAHQCEVCHKRFSQPEYLIDHKRIHTGEKPFGCDECSKFFRKKSALREHKKLHSDEKKYTCLICGKGFKQIAGYWGHMKRHHVMN